MYGMQPMVPMQPVVIMQQQQPAPKPKKKAAIDSDMAMIILIVNIITPGLGTMVAGCADSENCCKWTCLGFLQMLLAPLIIGWVWAICTGVEL